MGHSSELSGKGEDSIQPAPMVLTLPPEVLAKVDSLVSASQQRRVADGSGLAFMGFSLADVTFSMILMGFGGASTPQSVIGIFFFTGPLLLLLATIFEWAVGHFLPMMICAFFTVFWSSFGLILLPPAGAAASYSTSGDAVEGAASVGYNAGLALYLIVLGFGLFTIVIMTLKTNLILIGIMFFADIGVFLLAGSYWKVSTGAAGEAHTLQLAGGAFLFVSGILGWYMTTAMLAQDTGLVSIPVFETCKPRSRVHDEEHME